MKLETIGGKLKEATDDIKSIRKEIKVSEKHLSKYSMEILNKDLSEATGKQIKLLMLLVNNMEKLGLTQEKMEKFVKKYTK